MMTAGLRMSLVASAMLLTAAPLAAQRSETPEQRMNRIERQVRQLQGRVFTKGQPADTAATDYEAAATAGQVQALIQRLDAVEASLATLTRGVEENGQRLGQLETGLARLRTESDTRLGAIEAARAETPAEPAGTTRTTPRDDAAAASPSTAADDSAAAPTPAATPADPAEAAYDRVFRAWEAKRWDETARLADSFVRDHPRHRRVSWANNLKGRALLDKGQPRAAAEVLLANYRGNDKGERAQDSLYYLGQALMKLNQPGQACKAYDELGSVYGASIRAPIRALLPAARSAAGCR
jgi:TolA-binding protein